MPFATYWSAVLQHFNGKVPIRTIAKILLAIIRSFMVSNGNASDYDVIGSNIHFDGILTPEHFWIVKKCVLSSYLSDLELEGEVEMRMESGKSQISDEGQMKMNTELYKSPEQVLVQYILDFLNLNIIDFFIRSTRQSQTPATFPGRWA